MEKTDSRFVKRTFQHLIWDGKFTKQVTKLYKISIVTTCMGRTHDLEQTLPFNIQHCKDYPNLEFVIINYNSKDLLDEYIKKNHMKDIESGLLNYYKTTEPQLYSMSHSRNIGFKVAKGDIVSSVDADIFLKEQRQTVELSYPHFLNKLANQQDDSKCFFGKGVSNLHGMLAFWKDTFIEDLGGYSEAFGNYYGVDDRDLMVRAFMLNYKFYWHSLNDYCDRIQTSKHEKVKNHLCKNVKESEERNRRIYENHFDNKITNPNKVQNIHFGKARLLKNFKEEIII